MLLTDSIIIKGGASSGKFLESNAAGLGAWGAVAQSGNNSQNLSDPLGISGCVLWLKADAGVFNDSGTTPAASGDLVQQWNDQSNSGNHATQTVTIAKPTFVTNSYFSKPAILFNGVSSFLKILDSPSLSPSYITIFAVANTLTVSNNNPTGSYVITKDPQAQGWGLAFAAGAGGFPTKVRFLISGDISFPPVLYNIDSQGDHIQAPEFDNKQTIIAGRAAKTFITSFAITGTSKRLNAYNGVSLLTGDIGIGGSVISGGYNLSGSIAEVIVYNVPLRNLDMTRVFDYLSTKYSIYS